MYILIIIFIALIIFIVGFVSEIKKWLKIIIKFLFYMFSITYH